MSSLVWSGKFMCEADERDVHMDEQLIPPTPGQTSGHAGFHGELAPGDT